MSNKKITRILFVCLGNICRSPSAEAIMKALVKREGIEQEFFIDSAGLYSGHSGELPDARMRRHAARRGYQLDSRARAFYPSADFAEFDMIIGMDDQNIAGLKRLVETEEELAKIFKMTDFCQKPTRYTVVPDPYYEGAEGFELVLDLLEDAVEGLLKYCQAR
jgi:protein-tyrosine phosphatase